MSAAYETPLLDQPILGRSHVKPEPQVVCYLGSFAGTIGLSPQRAVGSSRLDLTLGVLTSRVDDRLDLSTAELADLCRALELDFGPDLSGLRVYVRRKASHHGR